MGKGDGDSAAGSDSSNGTSDDEWWPDEDEYVRYLHSERAAYAWVMHKYGGLPPTEAKAAAEEFYYYEEPGAYRGLVFHDEPWHWAMVTIKGSDYYTRHRELAHPPDEYGTLDEPDT
ncbi:hypothetical protein GCM10009839_09410 [Catenulispora yoronensis]|uniref:Uncharacterized protein n=1 Tax=Catenulispora yoronensis TaxID=450799 RepID=A0ABN2TP83_9ACTN